MDSLETRLGRGVFRNPVFGASGCTGHGFELAGLTDLSRFGAVSLKTVTPAPRAGNCPERVCEVPSSVLNSIGLQNSGIEAYMESVLPKTLAALDRDQIIVSVGGDSVEDYVGLCRRLQREVGDRIAALELNAACPNVAHGAGFYSRDPGAARELVAAARAEVDLPLFVKLNTNCPNFVEVARAIEEAGADAIYTTNTPPGHENRLAHRPAGPGQRPGAHLRSGHPPHRRAAHLGAL